MRQHVRGLEVFFGQPLVERRRRGLMPTDSGKHLATCVSASFSTLQQGVEELLIHEEKRPLKITLTPAFAENWLMPRLSAFWAENPDIEIELVPSLKLVDLKHRGIDLAIRYGYGNWSGYHSTFLVSAQYVVVVAKGHSSLTQPSNISNLADCTWLFETTRLEHQKWAEAHGIDFYAKQNKFYPTNSLVLSAARAGLGLSLQSRALIERDLESNQLIEIASEGPETLGYYIVTHAGITQKQRIFVKWLLKASS